MYAKCMHARQEENRLQASDTASLGWQMSFVLMTNWCLCLCAISPLCSSCLLISPGSSGRRFGTKICFSPSIASSSVHMKRKKRKKRKVLCHQKLSGLPQFTAGLATRLWHSQLISSLQTTEDLGHGSGHMLICVKCIELSFVFGTA